MPRDIKDAGALEVIQAAMEMGVPSCTAQNQARAIQDALCNYLSNGKENTMPKQPGKFLSIRSLRRFCQVCSIRADWSVQVRYNLTAASVLGGTPIERNECYCDTHLPMRYRVEMQRTPEGEPK